MNWIPTRVWFATWKLGTMPGRASALSSVSRNVAGKSWCMKSRICVQGWYPSCSGTSKIQRVPDTYSYPFSSPGNVINVFKRHRPAKTRGFSSAPGAEGPWARIVAQAHGRPPSRPRLAPPAASPAPRGCRRSAPPAPLTCPRRRRPSQGPRGWRPVPG